MPRIDRTEAEPRVISRAQAYARGMSRPVVDRRVRSGRWRPVLPGVFLTRPDPVRRDFVEAGLIWAAPRAQLSGAEALVQYGVLRTSAAPLLVLTTIDRRPPRQPWLTVRPTHRLNTPVVLNGLCLAPVARAVADHCLTCRWLDDVRATVARAVQHQLCTVEQLQSEYDGGPRRGSALLRTALTEIQQGAASAPEARAGAALRKAELGPFEQNARIDLPGGGYYVADFLWRELRAVLEIDSVEYHFDQAEWARTLRRHRELEAAGYSVIHMRPAEVRNEASFVRAVESWLAGRRHP